MLITVEGVQNIGQPRWTNASAEIKRVVFVDEIVTNTAQGMFEGLAACEEFDLKKLDVSNVTTMHTMFKDCTAMTNIIWSAELDTVNLTTMYRMFEGCAAMKGNLLPENFNTANVTNMEKLYFNCTSLETLEMYDAFDTSNVTTMYDMFNGCNSLTLIKWSDNFNTSNVTNMSGLFANCKSISEMTFPTGFDTQNVTNMGNMFSHCESITELTLPKGFNTQNVTNMSTMFGFCYKLEKIEFEMEEFNTEKVTTISGMFRACQKMKAEALYDVFTHFTGTPSLTNISALFNDCDGLIEFTWPNVISTQNVTGMYEVFQSCDNLVKVDLTNMDTSSCTGTQQFFLNCVNLTTVIVDESWNVEGIANSGSMFSGCKKLVGGAGTTLSSVQQAGVSASDSYSAIYARIDGANNQQGYLTYISQTIECICTETCTSASETCERCKSDYVYCKPKEQE